MGFVLQLFVVYLVIQILIIIKNQVTKAPAVAEEPESVKAPNKLMDETEQHKAERDNQASIKSEYSSKIDKQLELDDTEPYTNLYVKTKPSAFKLWLIITLATVLILEIFFLFM